MVSPNYKLKCGCEESFTTAIFFMIQQIIQNEWRLWRRDSRTVWLAGSIVVISLLALVLQVAEARKKLTQRQTAQETSRKAWLAQGQKHPHYAAHFGNYAYKQPSVLTVFDPGLTTYTGTSVYMEPHRQNDFLLSESGERDTGARFGLFTPSFVCQFIVPLLIILLGFNLVVSEKNGGTYALYLAQGVSARRIIFGKTAAVLLLFAGFITVYMLLTGIVTYVAIQTEFSISSFAYLWAAYLLYYAIWCAVAVGVSSLAKTPGASISSLLLFWILTCIVLPKWAAGAAENTYPLTTNYAFKKKVAEDIANGLNGHDVSSDRAKRIEDSVLKAMQVDSVQHLKFNFEGYVMQRGEEYSSNVYDTHFSAIYKTLEAQRKVQSVFAAFSPFMMLRNISMAAANASLETEILFQQNAEAYRRSFVQTMNNDMMNNSKFGDWNNYKVKKGVYGTINDFEAPQKPLRWRLGFVGTEQFALLIWIGLLLFGIAAISRKNYL